MLTPNSIMASAQRRVRKNATLVQAIRAFRNIIHFGPWRRLALAFSRFRYPVRDVPAAHSSVMYEPADVAVAVRSLEQEGYFTGLYVLPEIIAESTSYWEDKARGVYIDAHEHCPAIAQIVNDPEVLRIVTAYFGCQPNLVECKLFITGESKPDALSTAFHFDHAGVRSLNVMIYLDAVGEEHGPHVLVPGTHKRKKLRDYFREMTPIDEIERRYPGRILTLTGPAGMVLIENAEVFHRRVLAKRRRAAVIAVFSTSRRRILSIGKDIRNISNDHQPRRGANERRIIAERN